MPAWSSPQVLVLCLVLTLKCPYGSSLSLHTPLLSVILLFVQTLDFCLRAESQHLTASFVIFIHFMQSTLWISWISCSQIVILRGWSPLSLPMQHCRIHPKLWHVDDSLWATGLLLGWHCSAAPFSITAHISSKVGLFGVFAGTDFLFGAFVSQLHFWLFLH